MSTVLVLASHPAGELLGAGGTIARHVRAGDEVYVVVMVRDARSVIDPLSGCSTCQSARNVRHWSWD